MFTADDVGNRVVNGKVVALTNAEKQAIADEWNANLVPTLADVAAERERRLSTSLTVTLSDDDYTIPVSDRALSLAPTAARRARAASETRPFPTDKGVVERSADDLDKIETALDAYATAVWRRVAELEAKVADGTITESDLESGWP